MIDQRHKLLPDQITLPLLWLGLLVNLDSLYTTTQSAVIGAVVGYLSFVGSLLAIQIGYWQRGYGLRRFQACGCYWRMVGLENCALDYLPIFVGCCRCRCMQFSLLVEKRLATGLWTLSLYQWLDCSAVG